jgi:hypothetical protein
MQGTCHLPHMYTTLHHELSAYIARHIATHMPRWCCRIGVFLSLYIAHVGRSVRRIAQRQCTGGVNLGGPCARYVAMMAALPIGCSR